MQNNQRATNLELQKWIARRHGFVVESAWLDCYRQLLGSATAAEDASAAALPPEKQIAIRQAFRHSGMLR
jgi:hypothetical protein